MCDVLHCLTVCSVGVLSGIEVIGFPPIRSIMSKAVAPKDQGELHNHNNSITMNVTCDLQCALCVNVCVCVCVTVCVCVCVCAGALFSVVAAVQVLSSVCATLLFFFLLPWFTIDLGWPAGHVFFFIAILCVLTWPFAM